MGDFFMRFSKKMVGLLGVCLAVGIIIASIRITRIALRSPRFDRAMEPSPFSYNNL